MFRPSSILVKFVSIEFSAAECALGKEKETERS